MTAASVGTCTTQPRRLSFYEHLPQVSSLIQHWLDGYRTVSAIAKAEEEEIPTFLMLRRLLLVAWVGSHSETEPGPIAGCFLHPADGCSLLLPISGASDEFSRNAP